MPKTIRLDISALMEKSGMTQTDLMHDLRVTYVTASRITKGRATSITFDVLAKLCQLFGVSPNDILILEDAPEVKGDKPPKKKK